MGSSYFASQRDLDEDVRVLGEDVRVRLFPRPQQVLDPRTGERVDGETPIPPSLEVHYRGMRLIFTHARSIRTLPGSEGDVEYRDETGAPRAGFVRVEVDDNCVLTRDLSFGMVPEPVKFPGEYRYNEENEADLDALFRAVAGA